MNIIIHLDKDGGKNCIKVCECFDLQQCIILLFKMNVLALADFLVTSLWVLFSLQYGPVFSFTKKSASAKTFILNNKIIHC